MGLVRRSHDIYSDTQAQHKTEVEPGEFAFGTTIVSAFQVGRVFGGGASNIGWATSTNGGATWKHGYLPGITGKGDSLRMRTSTDGGAHWGPARQPGGSQGLGGQPVVLPNGDVVVPYLGFTNGIAAIRSFRSTNGGASWSASTAVASIRHHTWPDRCVRRRCRRPPPTPGARSTWRGPTAGSGPVAAAVLAARHLGRHHVRRLHRHRGGGRRQGLPGLPGGQRAYR